MSHTKRPRSKRAVVPVACRNWKGDLGAALLAIVLVVVMVKGCNSFFPGDSEEPPPPVEESR